MVAKKRYCLLVYKTMISNKSNKFTKMITGMVTVNEKGQVVIPAAARSATNLHGGDKLLVVVHPSHESIMLIKPDGLEAYATQMLTQLSEMKESAS